MTEDKQSERQNSPYVHVLREQWRALCEDMPLLQEGDLMSLQRACAPISLSELIEIYLPLARLLCLYERSDAQHTCSTICEIQSPDAHPGPYIIAVTGSVAVGKTTMARALQHLLSIGLGEEAVALVSTDGFLYPNAVLSECGLMSRKGFPETYDRHALIHGLQQLRAGVPRLEWPAYSHRCYDVVPDQKQILVAPRVVILEGLHLLQLHTSDLQDHFFDISIYVDAQVSHIRSWYVERFLHFKHQAEQDSQAFLRHFSHLEDAEALCIADYIWCSVNQKNLIENILPQRCRADLIVCKGEDHHVQQIKLRDTEWRYRVLKA